MVDTAQLEALRAFDTPTICNALEIVAPERRGSGYSVQPFVCPRPDLKPIVGYARTATLRAMQPSNRGSDADTQVRLDYYADQAAGPHPTITVIEDLDAVPGYGAWWGEVNTSIHQGLGSRGVITNGSIRDLDDAAPGYQMLAGMVGPSHAWVHIEEFGISVTVHGMTVHPGDLIHADQHGAVVVPVDVVADIPVAVADIVAREKILIDASREPGFGIDVLRNLLRG